MSTKTTSADLERYKTEFPHIASGYESSERAMRELVDKFQASLFAEPTQAAKLAQFIEQNAMSVLLNWSHERQSFERFVLTYLR